MKSLRDISWLVDEPTYRASEALSYSTISKFYREGFEKIGTLFDNESTPSLSFGSMVDTLLTDGQDAFNAKYFVCTVPIVSDDFKSVALAIKDEIGNACTSLYELSDKHIVEYLDRFGIYQNNWKAETKAEKVRTGANLYYQMLLKSNGKEVVDTETFNDVMKCVNALKTNEATEFYFRKDNRFDNIERFYQLKYKGEYNKIPIRCMMDLAIVDHNKKTITPCDIKTCSEPEYLFPRSFMKYTYWMQAQLYTYLLKQTIEKDEYFKDFTILPWKFIVVSRYTTSPKVWEFDGYDADGDIEIKASTKDIKLKSWKSVVTELKYYLDNKPNSPIGIEESKPNSITAALEKW